MSALPIFFHSGNLSVGESVILEEDTQKHIVQVLRMHIGQEILLTDGKGTEAVVVITAAEKKKCAVQVLSASLHSPHSPQFHLGIAFTKNASRNEWLLEKATELGVTSIIPLSTTRTEREKFRIDRWQSIITSAMLQSRQFYLPHLLPASSHTQISASYASVSQKLIAHCMDGISRIPLNKILQPNHDTIILIGPEGDFTSEEVNFCISSGYQSISLGTQRLRTETAAMAVSAYFNMVNHVEG